ncbi:MAG: FHA domain-containing protein [Cellvibrionaceae bacterium]|nr:FHA domain-containing protein [Cellvibrionaceae bacterium]
MTLVLRLVDANDQVAGQDRRREWTGSGGTIGRAPGNDWVLSDKNSEISRVHAKVYFDNGHYYLEDMSTNGIFLGAEHKRIKQGPYQLQSNDLLHIGHYQINVNIEKSSAGVSMISADAGFEQEPSLMSAPAPLRSAPPDSGALCGIDEQSSFTPAAVASQAAGSFIPEDWAVVSSSASGMTPVEISSAHNKDLTQQAQKEAAYKTMQALLSNFDKEYITSCLSLNGGQDKVFERIFNEIFIPEYQRKLASSS